MSEFVRIVKRMDGFLFVCPFIFPNLPSVQIASKISAAGQFVHTCVSAAMLYETAIKLGCILSFDESAHRWMEQNL